MKVTGSDLMELLLMIKTLTIINNPTFWVAHDAYLSSRFQLLQILEKHTLLGPIVRQFEKSRPGLRVRVKALRDRRAKLRFAATYTDKEASATGTSPISATSHPATEDLLSSTI